MDCNKLPSDHASCGDPRRSTRKRVQTDSGEPSCSSQQQRGFVKKASPCVSSTGVGSSNPNRKRKRSAKSSSPPIVKIPTPSSGHLAELICPPQFIDVTNLSSSSSETKRKCLKRPTSHSIVDLTGLSSSSSEWSQLFSVENIPVASSSSDRSPSSTSLLQDLLSGCPSGEVFGIEYRVYQGKYHEQQFLGCGGFGSVLAGYRKVDFMPVAVKRIPRQRVSWVTVTLEGRQQEIPLEVALLHIVGSGNPAPKGIVRLLDWCNLPEEVLLVLERPSPCEDLFEYISNRAADLKVEEAKVIMRQLVEAVQVIHNKGVVHRDLKPENVLIQSSFDHPFVHLIDFGCANLMRTTPFTSLRGTLLYTAPEWFTQNKLDGISSTVWQLGLIMYQILHHFMPFDNITEIIEDPLMMRKDLSPDCEHLLRWCLEKHPQGRPSLEDIRGHPWLY